MKRFRLLMRTRQTTEYSCGASALQTVMSFWGRDVDETELMRLLGTTPEEGTHPEDIVRVARSQGLDAELRSNLTLEEVKRVTDQGHPVIVLGQAWRSQAEAGTSFADDWDSGHWFIVLAIDEEYVYIEDPYVRMGKGFVPRATFEELWHNVMGGDLTKPKQVRMGIFIRGDRPAPPRTRQQAVESYDFSAFGSLNLIVTQFRADLSPYDFMVELKELIGEGTVRPDAFIYLVKDEGGRLSAIGGGRLEADEEIPEINAVLAVLAAMGEGDAEDQLARAQSAGRAAAMGDFGLSEPELKRIADKLPPGHAAIIVLFENLWERKFRDIARKYQGDVISQRLIPAAQLIELGEKCNDPADTAHLRR